MRVAAGQVAHDLVAPGTVSLVTRVNTVARARKRAVAARIGMHEPGRFALHVSAVLHNLLDHDKHSLHAHASDQLQLTARRTRTSQ